MTNAGKITQMSVTKLILTSSECPSMPQHLQIPAMMVLTGPVVMKLATMRGMLLTNGASIQEKRTKSVKMAMLLGRLGLTPWSS